jgi:hypothetical protein
MAYHARSKSPDGYLVRWHTGVYKGFPESVGFLGGAEFLALPRRDGHTKGPAVAWLAVGSLPVALWDPRALLAFLTVLGLLGSLDRDLLRLFHRRGGLPLVVGAGLLHLLYYLYSSLAFALVAVRTRIPAGE